MSKFIIVKEAPLELLRQEMVITMPDFKDEVIAELKRAPLEKYTNSGILKRIIQKISDNWDNSFNPITGVPYGRYEGLEFHNSADLSKIIMQIVRNHHPETIRAYIKALIKKRPLNTIVIYFVGPIEYANTFIQEGITELQENEVEKELGAKAKGIKTRVGITPPEA